MQSSRLPRWAGFVPLLLTVAITAVRACSPTGQNIWHVPDSQKAHHYDHILYGKVLHTFQDTTFDFGTMVYTAKMKVYCTYKGSPVPAVVNITEAGFIPGHCHAATLEPNKEYIVMVIKPNQELKVMFELEVQDNIEGATLLHNFTKACGLNLQYPSNVDPDSVSCPAPATRGHCVPDPKMSSAIKSDESDNKNQDVQPATKKYDKNEKDNKSGEKVTLDPHDTPGSPEKKAVISMVNNTASASTSSNIKTLTMGALCTLLFSLVLS